MPPFRILFVCTGNVCRSPTAQFLLRDRLAGAGAKVEVSSAGVGARGGMPLDASVQSLLLERGTVDGLEDFRSRRIEGSLVASADLVLTLTRQHRAFIGGQWPAEYPKVFTLREAAGILTPAAPAPQDPQALLELLQERRGSLPLDPELLDVADPIGRRMKYYRTMVDEVETALAPLIAALTPEPR